MAYTLKARSKSLFLTYLSVLLLSLFFTHLMRQQVKKAMDISRMMAQLTMEAITATLNPKVSYFDIGLQEGTSAVHWVSFPFHMQVMMPGPSSWCSAAHWKAMTVPTAVPLP